MLLLAAGLLGSCYQNNGAKHDSDSTSAAVTPLVSTPFFYTQLKGSMDNKPITMQLLRTTPNAYTGYYCYDSIGMPLSLTGTGDSGLVKIYEEGTTGDNERFFSGQLTNEGTFKGVWHGDGTSHHFDLHTSMDKAIPFIVLYAMDSAKLLPGRASSPVGTIASSMLWPDSTTAPKVADFIKAAITGNAHTNPVAFLRKGIDSFLTSYKGAALTADSSEFADETTFTSWNWSSDNDIKVVWNKWPLLVLERYVYDFSGGAHGNWGVTYVTLDLSKQKILRPEDIFKPAYKTQLSPLLDKAFKKKYNLSDDQPLGQNLLVQTIPPNDNFIVTDKGVAFSYVPYEIGPYVLGQVTLFLPFKDLKPLLK